MNLMESLLANKLAAKQSSGGSNLTPEVKEALLDCFANVAWAVEDGQQYYDALADALYGLQSISAVYTQSGTVYDTDSLDSLKADLVVTALYGDGSTQTVPAESYTLSGTLTEGTSTITVSYGGKTATFNVTVSRGLFPVGYTPYDYIVNKVEAASSTTLGSAFSLGFGAEYSGTEFEHEVEFAATHIITTSSPLLGIRKQTGQTTNARNIWLQANSGDKFAVVFSEHDTGFTNECTLNTKYKVKTTVSDNSALVLVNDTQVASTSVASSFEATGNFQLFGTATGTSVASIRSTAKVYSYKVKNLSTGEYVCDFRPCANSSGNAGVYDVIRGNFYTHSDPATYLDVGNDEG